MTKEDAIGERDQQGILSAYSGPKQDVKHTAIS